MTQRFCSVREVVETLGISRTCAYSLVREGVLPSVKVQGSGIRVPMAALEVMIREMEEEAKKHAAA